MNLGPALELDGVGHVYRRLKAVEKFSLAVNPGEVVRLLDRFGCGKTTVLRLPVGLQRPQRGRVSI